MRLALSVAAAVMVCLACASAQNSNPASLTTVAQTATLSPGETTITGCVKGSTDGFYLMQQDGTMRLLMGRNRMLRPLVDHWVELGGNRDDRRDASASSDEGTPHGLRFFQVEEVIANQGPCKR